VLRRLLALLAVLGLLVACSDDAGDTTSDGGAEATATGAGDADEPDSGDDPDGALRLNDIQVIGTHNSYHQRLPDELFELLEQFDADLAASLDYEQPPLTEQLERLGARQLELDVFADPDGGRYATRVANELAGLPVDAPPAMQDPGFKVLHVQEVDYESSCLTFVDCLTEVRDWSVGNPGHLPILVLVEAKDADIGDPVGLGFVVPIRFTASLLDDLDAEIAQVFEADHVLTPDDVRGDAGSLREVVTGDGWPTLAESRGKVMFALDNENRVRDAYLRDHETLEDRMMFASVDPDDPAAGFVKLNDPLDDGERIAELVEQGFVIRTRADADTVQARTNDTRQRKAALESGAQYVSTDYMEPDPRFTEYSVRLPGGLIGRCNPVRAPEACEDAQLESR
jgi:hypothetical protein